MNNNLKMKILPLFASLAIAGCGGSDKKEPTPSLIPAQNIAPTVSVSDVVGLEGSDISVSASASDSDGQISSYQWGQTSGNTISIADTDLSTLAFTAPRVSEDTNLGFKLTVTDDDGATSSDDFIVTIKSNVITVSISGKVTDGPIANAKVKLSVLDEDFEITADASGNYVGEISLDDEYLADLVKVEALGADENSPVKLISYLGSLKAISDAAGDDSILDKSEMFGVNVTNVTTAVSALWHNANNGTSITSVETLEAKNQEINPELIMPLATAIKLVIDYSNENLQLALPEGISNTLDLVSDLDTASRYIANAQANASDAYTQAMDEIFHDPELLTSNLGEANSLVGTYYFKGSDGRRFGDRLVLNSNGRGYLNSFGYDGALSWTSSAEGLNLTFEGSGLLTSYGVERVDELGESIYVEHFLTKRSIKLLSSTDKSLQVGVRSTSYQKYPDGQLPNSEPEESRAFVYQMVKQSGIQHAESLIDKNIEYIIPVPHNEDAELSLTVENGIINFDRSIMRVTLRDNNQVVVKSPRMMENGDIAFRQINGNYEFTDNGHLKISVLDDDEDTVEWDIALFNSRNPFYANVKFSNESEQWSLASSDELLKKESSWNDTNVAGIYTLEWNFDDPLNYFWVEVNNDGTALTVSANDFNNDGTVNDDEFFQAPGLWELNEDGNLKIRRYRSKNNSFRYCQSNLFNPSLGEDCIPYHEREWNLQKVTVDGNYAMEHIHRFYDTFHNDLTDESPLVVRFGYMDNRKWRKISERPIKLPQANIGNSGLNVSALVKQSKRVD